MQCIHTFSQTWSIMTAWIRIFQVKSVMISDDKKYIVTGSKDRTVRLWDMSTGKQLSMFHTQSDIYEVQISKDNSFIIARGDKGVSDKFFILNALNL